jgi:hypothetical protein
MQMVYLLTLRKTPFITFSLPRHPPPSLPKQHHHSITLALALVRLSTLWISNRTRRRKEQNLDCNGKPGMQRQYNNEQNLARLGFGGAKHGVQVTQQEESRECETQRDENVVEN